MMNNSRRRLMSGAVYGLAASNLPVAQAQSAPLKGGILKMVPLPEPNRLQSAFDTGTSVQVVAAKMHNGLLNYGPDFKPRPELAERWVVSEDSRNITFHLRAGVKWHDGEPFTSADVKFTLEEVIKKLHSRGRGVFANLERVDTPDPLTAIFRLSNPAPYIMSVLYAAETPMLPRHVYVKGDLLANPANMAPIGTGPFRFKEWRRGSHILLERNPDYFEPGKPHLDGVLFRIIPDASARAVAFESGEIDVSGSWPVPMPDMNRFRKVSHLAITQEGYKASASMDFLEFNLRDPLFQDVRVRQAIAHAIDLEFIADTIYYGLAKPATGHFSESMEAFYSADQSRYPYDIKRAERLLDEAGRKRGADGIRFSFTIDPAPFGERFVQTAEYVAQALSRVGIRVQLRQQDLGSWLRRIYTTRECQVWNYGVFSTTDPNIGPQRQYWSKSIQDGVPFSNGSGYRNQRIDQIFEAGQIEASQEKRKAMFAEMQKILSRDLPNIPLMMSQGATVYNRKVNGMLDGLVGIFDTFADVWLSRP